MPLLRVVVPTFNRAPLLEEALQSVAAQTVRDFDVVVADDGSTDETGSVLLRWQQRDSRFRSVFVGHRGVAAARNAALAHPGKFKYAAFLDSDDLWTANHLADCIQVLENHHEIAMAFAVFQTIDQSGSWTAARLRDREERIRRPARLAGSHSCLGLHLLDSQAVHHALLRGEFSPHPSTTVVRASAVGKLPWFDESLEVLEDCLFFLRIASSGQRFAYFDTVHSRVRHHGDNLTGTTVDLGSPTTLRREVAVFRYLNIIQRYCQTADDRSVTVTRIADQAYVVGQCHAEQRDLAGARRYYLRSLRRPSAKVLKSLIAAMLPAAIHSALRRRRSASNTSTSGRAR